MPPSDPVKFPGAAVDPQGADLEAPLAQLLQGLGLLGKPEDLQGADGAASAFSGPPQSVAILEAGATAFSKWWTAAIAALGGATAITAAANKFWLGTDSNTHVALVAGAAFVIGAALIAIGLMVTSDVRARGEGQAALYQMRAHLASVFLRNTAELQALQKASSDLKSLGLLSWSPHREVIAEVEGVGAAEVPRDRPRDPARAHGPAHAGSGAPRRPARRPSPAG